VLPRNLVLRPQGIDQGIPARLGPLRHSPNLDPQKEGIEGLPPIG
jgi:hypothetical protein